MAEGDTGGITYTVKEMLAQLDQKIDRIDAKLDSKVDVSAFAQVQQRVEMAADRAIVLGLEIKVNDLISRVELQDKVNAALADRNKRVAETSAQNFTRREKIVGALMGLAALFISAYGVFGGVG